MAHTYQQQGGNHSKRRVLNILLLGKSGVGKSTFINSFANYVYFETVKDIEDQDSIRVPIPCNFDVFDDEGNHKNFKMGDELNEDRNESMNSTSSGTQGCKAYQFDFESLKINLIDTPGIVDTDGIEKDKQNLENILEFISIFKSIDGICILLKPNEERLDPVLRYCILELLSQLEESAAQNIVFGFTNARCTLYRPGNTAKAIQELIAEVNSKKPNLKLKFSKENYFCFDSEAFRFLISKDSVEFDDLERNMFVQSWSKSRQECVRMINFIAGLPKHDVQNTISINKARKLIESLLKPLVDIAENIMENQELCKKHEKEINSAQDDISMLKTKLYIPRSNISMEYYKSPRFVCGSKKCTEVVSIGKEEKPHYAKVCYEMNPHNTVNALTSVVTAGGFAGAASMLAETFGVGALSLGVGEAAGILSAVAVPAALSGMALAGAGAIFAYFLKNGRNCSSCSCAITDHFVAYYETRKSTERIVDEEIESKMKSKEDILAGIESFLTKLKMEIQELENESTVINRASSTFALFLKYKAITPYNDASEEYLKYLIEVNKNDSNMSDEDRAAKQLRLEKQKNQYQSEKSTIENGFKRTDSIYDDEIRPEHIDNIVAELCSLKRHGHIFKNSVGKTQEIRERDKRFRIIGCSVSKMMTSLFQNRHTN